MEFAGRLVPFGAVLALCAGIVVACGDDTRPAASDGNGSAGGVRDPQCATPTKGCACTGTTAKCAYEVKGDDDFLFCAEGERSCIGGVWGDCIVDGHMTVSSRPALTSSVTASTGGLQFQALGSQTACGSLNPCDPYCQVTSDTPVGIDAGPGFTVVDGGIMAAGCGDGQLLGAEECDDGNVTSGDGCSKQCLLEAGFQCVTPGKPCTAATCGNGTKEGAEECDDGNSVPYDGCSATCQREVTCPGGLCQAVCGDGLKFATEACDDGNLRNGDGCSSTCTVETGSTCTTVTSDLPATLDVPVIYRDFTPTTNPDFEGPCCGRVAGIVKDTLAADGKPVFNATQGMVTSATTFNQWYHDSTASKFIYGTLTLTKQPDTSYVFSSNAFFPLNGKGFGNYGTTGKNFHFTSELRYPFTFAGGEVLSFTGDDDVFVFINNKLAVDIGGVHGAENGSVTLNAATATTLGLATNNVYELVVFQAERHTVDSNYKLTLRGFVRAKSVCAAPSSLVVVRDFSAACSTGSHPVWQLFRWKAAVPVGTSIDFRAATAATQAALPASPPAVAPTTVPIGSATPTNSPFAGPVVWVNDMSGTTPVTVAQHLKTDGNNTQSKQWLRVYMSFNPLPGSSPRLDEWQQQFDCVPDE